ncbi:GLPGLI family protein [Niastella caeni]|uniref:GLPGLI family protein n=1 Tax=Niastella caeni TaxID=2569763 RepID=A0A4S8HU94_9BACT|nr:GLPGLI family protein [Niastella caeni]THU39167.1 GLPGLI family protein [Niastella caeni]
MKQLLLISFCWLIISENTQAQDFITRGKIEYEIRKDNKKIYTDADRARSNWIASLPEFDILYRELVFSNNQLLYLPGRKGTLTSHPNDNSVYSDLDTRKTIAKQTFINEAYIIEDSVRPIKWKIGNEIRKIAGFECRKAIGIIHDSVYVVAFYCPEIIPQGGPEFFSGLPGMILGLAIPRYFTTWFATKIELASLDESTIAPPTVKKSKQYSKNELADILSRKYKEAGWWKEASAKRALKELDRYTF